MSPLAWSKDPARLVQSIRLLQARPGKAAAMAISPWRAAKGGTLAQLRTQAFPSSRSISRSMKHVLAKSELMAWKRARGGESGEKLKVRCRDGAFLWMQNSTAAMNSSLRSITPKDQARTAFRSPQRIPITVPYSTYQKLIERSGQEGRSLSNLSAYLLEAATGHQSFNASRIASVA